MRFGLLALAAFLVAPASALAAAPDNNVEWTGVSHVAWQDRRPLCPVGGETFQVRFQAYRDDITSARVRVDNGSVQWIDAARVGTRGLYDVWAAQVPATATTTESYYLELTDGTDTDYYTTTGMVDADPGSGGFALNFSTFEHAPVGATRTSTGGAVFKVWAPTRTTVHVRGSFNGWGLGNPMAKVGEHFVANVSGVADRSEYKYFFNGSVWRTDARARALNAPTTNSDGPNGYVESPFRYAWVIPDFATPALEKMVIYQLHVGTFAGYNDPVGTTPFPSRYVDVAARVEHLRSLGVNAVMLNPITEFPGDLSAGYNPESQWAPEWKYGTPDELKAMIDVLHQNGIAVILDIVWNHFTTNDNFMWNYDGTQTYFDSPAVDTPWGSQADFDRVAVQDYYANSALQWMEEYKIDGFRMDATSYMDIAPQAAAGWALMQRLNNERNNRWADKVAIAEQLPSDAWITMPTAGGGAGFSSQYSGQFRDNIRNALFTAGGGDPQMWSVRDAINGAGTYISGRYAVDYIELHDEAWPSSGGQRIVKTIDPTAPNDDIWAQGRLKLGEGMVMFAPGVPAFLMGDEWLENIDFGTETTNRIDWSKKTTYAPIFRYFQDIILLRRESPALRADAQHQIFHLDENGNVIAFRRYDGQGHEFVILANFGNTDYASYRLGAPRAGDWQEIINSQSLVYGGSGYDNPGMLPSQATPYDGFSQSLVIKVPKMGLLVLTPAGVVSAPAPGASVASPARLVRIAPSPARPRTTITYELAQPGRVSLTLLDVTGRRVTTLVAGDRTAGVHVADWDGRDPSGAALPAGVYFVRLEAAGQRVVRRLALVR